MKFLPNPYTTVDHICIEAPSGQLMNEGDLSFTPTLVRHIVARRLSATVNHLDPRNLEPVPVALCRLVVFPVSNSVVML